ncbi:MAG: PAS domain-containing protein [Caldimonas sp.]
MSEQSAVPFGTALLTTWLEQSNDLLALTDPDGAVAWANGRFVAATGLAPGTGSNLLALAPTDPAYADSRAALARALADGALPDTSLDLRSAGGGNLSMQARATTAAGQILWTLQDTTSTRKLVLQAQRQTELLDMAQEFGRLGVWERVIPSGEGHWDRHIFGFWGLDPRGGTPNYKEAIQHIHPDDRTLMSYVETTHATGRYSQRYRVLRPDGTTRWIHSQWEVKSGPDGKPSRAIGIMVDDTVVYNSARALGEANAQLELAVELGRIAIWRHDLKTHCIHYNERGLALFDIAPRAGGVPADEMLACVHPEDRARVVASAERALAADSPTDLEARYRRADGGWRHVLMRRAVQRGPASEPLAFLGVALDVTEHHAALAALRQASERAALITRHAGIGTWEADLDGGPERWDEQMFHLRALPPSDTALNRAERLALVHPDDVHRLLDARPNGIRGGLPGAYEFRVRLPDGSFRWLASRSTVLRDERGVALRRVGVNWDITEGKNADIARQQAALAEREIQAKSQFLSRMSHELRTPLNAVLGFTQLLQIEASRAASIGQVAKLGHIRSAGEHLLALINDVLDLSSLESGELRLQAQPLDLGRLVAQTLPLVEPLAQQHGVTLRNASGAAVALADPTRMRQILINLFSNAIKYNRRGGEVVIETRAEPERVSLTVRDTGRGLTRDQLAHLFEPFNRLGIEREGIDGTGIGLTIVKALVEGMSGAIDVSSRPGKGTRFVVTLPAGDPGAVPVERPATVEPHVAEAVLGERDGQLLYIEDNHVNVLLVEELVRSLSGLKIESASTGAAGVARATALQPDLILVDLQLPDFDGFEVLRRLRAQPQTAATPCVALSANAMPEDIARGLAAGFADYWTKPIDFKTFLSALERRFPAGTVT